MNKPLDMLHLLYRLWGFDGTMQENISNYTLTLPITVGVNYVAVASTVGSDAITISNLGNSQITFNCFSNFNSNNHVRRPTYYILVAR